MRQRVIDLVASSLSMSSTWQDDSDPLRQLPTPAEVALAERDAAKLPINLWLYEIPGDITRYAVPSHQGFLSLSTTCPAELVCTRSLASAGRVMILRNTACSSSSVGASTAEDGLAVGAAPVHTVQHQAVQVDVQVGRRAKDHAEQVLASVGALVWDGLQGAQAQP